MAELITDDMIAQAKADRDWHPLAEVFPLMDDDQFQSFVDDIGQRGQRESIKVWNGQVIDGRNRQIAVIWNGHSPDYRDVSGEYTEDELADYVWSLNFERRHLNPSQQAMAAQRMKEATGKTTKEVVQQTGSSDRMVKRAARVKDKGCPELIRAVESGDIRLGDAEKIVDLDHEEQRARVASVMSGKSDTVTKIDNRIEPAQKGDKLTEFAAPFVAAVRDIDRISEEIDLPDRNAIELSDVRTAIVQMTPKALCCDDLSCEVCMGKEFLTEKQWAEPGIRAKHQLKHNESS